MGFEMPRRAHRLFFPSSVDEFLAGLSDPEREIVEALRAVVRRETPAAAETMCWDAISYHRPERKGKIKGGVCQIVARDVVRLDFVHGVRLPDPRGILQGDRRSKRFVPIRSVEDARRPEIAEMIAQADALVAP